MIPISQNFHYPLAYIAKKRYLCTRKGGQLNYILINGSLYIIQKKITLCQPLAAVDSNENELNKLTDL